jgi:glycosyltransferase involved in cell wall biosynthesis
MKILIVNTRHYLGGGDSTYAFNLAELLRKNGHEVNFFAMQDERNIPDSNADLFVSHIDFRKLNKTKNPLTGLKVISRSIYSFEARSKFSKLLDRLQPEIIHLQNIHAHITPSIIFEARKRNIPVVWTLHDYKLLCPNSHFLIDETNQICEECTKKGYFCAIKNKCKKGSLLASVMAALEAEIHKLQEIRYLVDAYLCPSSFMESKLIENHFPPDKVFHLPLFINSENVNEIGIDKGYFLFLGKLEPLKGVDLIIDAAKQLPEIKFKLAGNIDERNKLDLLNRLPANCDYLGLLQGEELQRIKMNAKALIFPSIWYENQPFSILEMFALGKPVIATNIGGMRELVGENERGWLIELGDVTRLVSTIEEVVNNDELYQEKARNAYKYVLAEHTEERHYDRLLKIYQGVK